VLELAFQGRDIPLEAVDGPTIVPGEVTGLMHEVIREYPKSQITESRGDLEGALSRLRGGAVVSHHRERLGHEGGDLTEATMITQSCRENFGFTQMLVEPCHVSEWIERASQFESNIDGLLEGVGKLREMPESNKRLLEGCRRFAVSGTLSSSEAGPSQVSDCLVP
jgi:hypothetical protein